MATKFSNTLQMSNTTDALFRAWVQFIDDLLLVTGGWVNTTDTGQMTISTATHPTLAQTKVGYRIYKMADTLQATAPVFMRLDYGSSNVAGALGVWVTIGSGSDGAGNITGVVFNGGSTTPPTVASLSTATSACDSYGSSDTNRVHVLMFVRAGANDMMCFSLERTKDSNGNDTGSGLYFTYSAGSGTGNTDGVNTTQYIALSGSQPPSEVGVSFVLPNETSSAFASNVSAGIFLHYKSVPQPAGLGMVAINSGDFIAESTLSFAIYGNTRTYQLGNSNTSQVAIPAGNATKVSRANTRVGIRFD